MNPKTEHKTSRDAIDRILAVEEELIPSSGFLAETMERVREEAAMPRRIPFPWLRALPGIVLAVAVLCWSGFELMRAVLTAAQERASVQVQLSAATARAMEPAGWVALALFVSMLSWLFARRLAGRSGLL
jgi:hypothetical protein